MNTNQLEVLQTNNLEQLEKDFLKEFDENKFNKEELLVYTGKLLNSIHGIKKMKFIAEGRYIYLHKKYNLWKYYKGVYDSFPQFILKGCNGLYNNETNYGRKILNIYEFYILKHNIEPEVLARLGVTDAKNFISKLKGKTTEEVKDTVYQLHELDPQDYTKVAFEKELKKPVQTKVAQNKVGKEVLLIPLDSVAEVRVVIGEKKYKIEVEHLKQLTERMGTVVFDYVD